MCPGEYVFTGVVRLCLEGQDALFPYDERFTKTMHYAVGASESPITVIDHRARAVWAAQKVLSGADEIDFADTFSREAWVQIRECSDCIEIELDEIRPDGPLPTLWLGVLEGDAMPYDPGVFEALCRVPGDRTAFAVVFDELALESIEYEEYHYEH